MKASYRVLDISRVFGDKYQGSVWEKYKRVGTLGEGHYGKVHKAKRRVPPTESLLPSKRWSSAS